MRLFKSWAYRVVGAFLLVWGFLCIVSDAFDFDFIAPGFVLGTVIMLVGGILFVNGWMAADEPSE